MGKTALAIVQKYYPHVTRLVDAKRDAEIEVTSQDCKRSKQSVPNECAMARAFKRTVDGAVIALTTAYLVKGDKAFRYKVPGAIAREIVSFDRHKDFAPGGYKLNAPSASFALGFNGRLRGGPDLRKSHSSKKKLRHHRTAGIRSL